MMTWLLFIGLGCICIGLVISPAITYVVGGIFLFAWCAATLIFD